MRSKARISEERILSPCAAFGEDKPVQVSRKELANIIEARVEEIFDLVLQEIKRSGYDGLAAGRHGPDRRHQPAARHPQPGQPVCSGLPVRIAQPGKPGRADRSAQFTRLFHQRRSALLGADDE